MRTSYIQFTPGEARAILWYLQGIVGNARANRLADQLQFHGYVDVYPKDRELMVRSVSDNAWLAALRGRNVSYQRYRGAVRCLWNARDRIAAACDMKPDDISFPQA